MKAIPILKACDASDLKIVEWDKPIPKENEVLIKTHAFGVNFADIMARKGQYADAPKMPFVPGYEVSGEIEAVGSAVTRFAKGDRVLALTLFGGYAEYAVTDERTCFHLPENMTFEQGASIPVNFVTAWHSIFETGTVRPGYKILIHAAAGGVGQAAIQLARHAKLEIFGTAGGSEKKERLKALGVHHAIDYRSEDFVERVKSIAPEGIHLILDSVGGSQLKRELSLLLPHGRIAGYGAASFSQRSLFKLPGLISEALSMVTYSVIDLMMNSRGFYGVNMLHVAKGNIDLFHEEMVELMKLFKSKSISTVELHSKPAEKISDVHASLESRGSSGKFVLTF